MPRHFLVVLLAALIGLAGLRAGAAEPAFPRGLRIGLEPPGDARPSVQFPGFEDPERQVAITILDLPPGAYSELQKALLAKDQPGLEDVKRESFPFESGIGFLLSGHQQANGAKIYKWVLLAKAIGAAQGLTALIAVTVPEAARSIYTDAVIRKALASVTFRATPIGERLAMLPFKLGDLAGFHIFQVTTDGAVILTDGPGEDLNVQPYMVISAGSGAPPDAQARGRFARDLINTAPLRAIAIQSAESMRIGGGPGYEIRARAVGLKGDVLSLVQWLRFGSSGFLRVVGVSHSDKWDTYFSRFRTVRDGIEAK